MRNTPLVEVNNLIACFHAEADIIYTVNDACYNLREGETTTGHTILQLHEAATGRELLKTHVKI